MRIYWAALVTALIGMGSGHASEPMVPLTYKAPPPKAAPTNVWTGWYVGGTVGAAFNHSNYELDPAGCFISAAPNCGLGGAAANPYRTFSNWLTNTGLSAGGQIGYNYQLTPLLVVGLEADLNYGGTRRAMREIG